MSSKFEIPNYDKKPISLIPGGFPQFLDYQASAEILKEVKYNFAEDNAPSGSSPTVLHAYRKGNSGDFIDETDRESVYREDGYSMNGPRDIQPFLGQWMPLPFLHVREQNWEDGEGCRFEYGPTNWARGRLTVDPLNPDTLRLVLAFDMQVEKEIPGIYAALTQADVDGGAHFRLAWRLRDNSWFLNLPWVDAWIREVLEAWDKQNRKRRDDDLFHLQHLAAYLVYLECVQKISQECEVFLVCPASESNVNVDLVLDIGNSRTTGILVESRPQSVPDLNNSYLLQLRDMSQPENVYTDPFETRIEFTEINFGNYALSLHSGREEPAFVWPSPARIGPEAARLSTLSRCGEGSTGMSSPKRYLWDERDWTRSWRYNTQTENAPYVVRGPLAMALNSSGTPLCCMDDPLFRRNKNLMGQDDATALESYFTPSSLMMFLFVEIIEQALLTINEPGQRLRRADKNKPRRLRQIIFTLPAGMPLAEQRIYKRWANWAVRVLWEAMGWEHWYVKPREKQKDKNNKVDYRTSPKVRCEWDEATCTQLVFIYNEITKRFQGDVGLFYELMGKERIIGGKKAPTVRIATIDIGGGTTDMSITTFELASEPGSSTRLAPWPEFHDGFSLAGDDILKSVIEEHILPAIGAALGRAGIINPQSAIKTLFGKKGIGNDIAETNQQIQFTRQIAVPVALCLLDLYERKDPIFEPSKLSFRLKDCFIAPPEENGEEPKQKLFTQLYPFPGEKALNYVADYVRKQTGNDQFDILDVRVEVEPEKMHESTSHALNKILEQLCEVIKAYDCDVLLLTGRPTRWPGIVNKIMSFMAVPPGRIFPMATYRMDTWYPFRDAMGIMTDPKTTVVVGAILCALAEGHLEGFSFDPSRLIVPSTARYIGELEESGQLRREKVWFTVDPKTGQAQPEEKSIIWNGPISIGFRQLETERWPTTRFYILDSDNDGKKESLRVQLAFRMPDKEEVEENAEARDDGEFEIISIKNENDEEKGKILQVRLQTQPRDDLFWMDSGVIIS